MSKFRVVQGGKAVPSDIIDTSSAVMDALKTSNIMGAKIAIHQESRRIAELSENGIDETIRHLENELGYFRDLRARKS